jgi:hypothetical protein
MKIGNLCGLVIVCLAIGFTGCDTNVKMTDKSGLATSSLSDLGASIGMVWDNPKATNLAQSKKGNWDGDEIADIAVIKVGYKYNMWYSGKQVIDTITKWQIGYAYSTDGINWTKADTYINPVITTTSNSEYENKSVRLCSVIYDSGAEGAEYKMWYRGYGVKPGSTKTTLNIMHAYSSSPDSGWYKYPASATDSDRLPTPITLADNLMTLNSDYSESLMPGLGTLQLFTYYYYFYQTKITIYMMWYTKNGYTDNTHYIPMIQSAYSDSVSGFTNSVYPTITDTSGNLCSSGYYMPTVIQDVYKGGSAYKMWFMSYLNSSGDGLGFGLNTYKGDVFSLQSTSTVTKAGDVAADKLGMTSPCVIRDGSKYKLWYVGTDQDGKKTVCYKESISH